MSVRLLQALEIIRKSASVMVATLAAGTLLMAVYYGMRAFVADHDAIKWERTLLGR